MGTQKGGMLLFLLGAAAGLASGFWLNSESGKDWRKKAAEKAKAKADDLKAKTGEAAEKVGECLSEAADKIKHMGEKVAYASTHEAVQEGVKKANGRLDDLEEELS